MRQWWKEHGRKWAFRLCGLALTAAVAVSLLPETVVQRRWRSLCCPRQWWFPPPP